MSIGEQNKAKISHFLGIDFGMSKVGLAMADAETKIAFAYGELPNNAGFLEKLGEIIQKENINFIILGELNTPGKNAKAFDVRKIGEEIRNKFNIKVEYQEEMFTTKMAGNNLKETGARNINKSDNAEAARIILEDYLNSKR